MSVQQRPRGAESEKSGKCKSSLQLYLPKMLTFILDLSDAIRCRISVLERKVVAVGNTQFLSIPDIPERAVDNNLALEISLPADILVLS